MAQITRRITDVQANQVTFQQSLLEADGFTVEVQNQSQNNDNNGPFILIGTKDDGNGGID